MLKAIAFSVCYFFLGFGYSQEYNSAYFKSIDQSYSNFLVCNKAINKRAGHFPIKIQSVKSASDTLIYKVDFFELYNSLTIGQTEFLMGEDYLFLKIINDRLFLDYDSKVKESNPALGLTMEKLIDLQAPLNECNEISNYFYSYSGGVRVCFLKRIYNHYLNDTIYYCRIDRNQGIDGHAALPVAFWFTKKHGFIIWEFGIQNKDCRSVLIDSRFRKKNLITLIKD